MSHRWLGWALWAVLTVLSLIGLARLDFNFDFNASFEPRSPREREAASLLRDFPLYENAFVILARSDHPFDPATFRVLEELDVALWQTPGIERAVSIFDAPSRDRSNGFELLFPGPNLQAEELEAAASEARDSPAVRGLFLGNQGKRMLFYAEPAPEADQLDELQAIEDSLHETLAALPPADGLSFEITGVPVLKLRIVGTIMQEQVLYAIAGGVLGGLIGWLVFRSFAAIILVFLTPQVASSWVLGGMGLVGEPVTVMNSMVTVLVMVLALAEAMHLLFAICRQGKAGASPKEAVVDGIEEVGGACLLTGLTTAIAFASLVFSSNPLVVRFGLVCSAGSLLVIVAVLVVIPLLASTRWFGQSLAKARTEHLTEWRLFPLLARRVTASCRLVVLAALALLVLAVGLSSQLEAGFSYRESLDQDHPQCLAIEEIDQHFGGSQPLYLAVRWPQTPGGAPHPHLGDYLAAVHEVVNNTGADIHGRPFSLQTFAETYQEPLASILSELPRLARHAVLQTDDRITLVTVPMRDAGTRAVSPFLADLEQKLAELEAPHPGFEILPAGLMARANPMSQNMIHELAISLGVAAALIFLVIILALRSVRLGLISILPNVLPIATTLGLLSLLGEPLRYNSALALTICLGIAVDDTIHFLFRYQRERMAGLRATEAVARTLPAVGAALVASTLILVAGLAMLLFSAIPTIRIFGLLCIFTLLMALLADLVVLPAMVSRLDRRGRDIA